jgi:hypothetical protein
MELIIWVGPEDRDGLRETLLFIPAFGKFVGIGEAQSRPFSLSVSLVEVGIFAVSLNHFIFGHNTLQAVPTPRKHA